MGDHNREDVGPSDLHSSLQGRKQFLSQKGVKKVRKNQVRQSGIKEWGEQDANQRLSACCEERLYEGQISWNWRKKQSMFANQIFCPA